MIQIREWARRDLYFLLRYVLRRSDVEHPWIFERCREVQADPDGRLDLWAREHYKSTVITYALCLQDILSSHGDDPLPDWHGREMCIGIFSHTRPSAKGFLRQIKRELEGNELLRDLFPDIVWGNPRREAPKWSEDDGLVVRRQSNPKEATLEAWGIVDSQPTGKHFPIRVYDDVVEQTAVRTPESIRRTTASWEASLDLGAAPQIVRYIGTRWHHNDTYRTIIERGSASPRIHTITVDATVDGEPVLKTREEVAQKRRDQGPYQFSAQQLQNPTGDTTMGFDVDWLRYYDKVDIDALNLYMFVDPANEKKRTSDYTVMLIVGYGADENLYLVDGFRDRWRLSERVAKVFELHRKYRPKVYYEQYGMQSDIQAIENEQETATYRFDVTPVHSQVSKNDRIRGLVPWFEQGRIYLPRKLVKVNYEGQQYDFVDRFINEEYRVFPLPIHDDMLDCLAWAASDKVELETPNEEQHDASDWLPSGSGGWAA